MLQFPLRLLCACTLVWAAGTARAEEPQDSGREAFVAYDWQAAGDAQLDALRGGFELSSVSPGLAVSFGFARTVSINGDVVAQTRFTLPDLAHISAEQARQVTDALGHAQLVQNGLGNSVGSGNVPVGLAAASIVQNSLNNQNIQTLTQIDAGVNSMGMLHSMNTQGALRDALMGAIGAR